jgi:hypothetical protein
MNEASARSSNHGKVSRSHKIVIIFLDMFVLLAVASCIPLVTYLHDHEKGSPPVIAAPFAYRVAMAGWAIASRYGLSHSKPWGRDSAIGFWGLLLFGAAGGIVLSLLPMPNKDRVLPNVRPFWVYICSAALVVVPLWLLVSRTRVESQRGAPTKPSE